MDDLFSFILTKMKFFFYNKTKLKLDNRYILTNFARLTREKSEFIAILQFPLATMNIFCLVFLCFMILV